FHVDGIRSKVLFPFYLIHLKTHRLISLRIPDYSCTHYLTNSLTILYSFSHLLKYDIIKVSNCAWRSEEHTSELQSRFDLVCRLLLEKKKLYSWFKCCH